MYKVTPFNLNDKISIAFEGKKVSGKLVGIDTYSLESFDGKKFDWPSYTLASDRKDKFKRFWFVRWGQSNWILWLQAKNFTVPINSKLLPGKSGIAKIQFEGDPGASTPFAALVQYRTADGYFAAERFAGSEVMYFSGHSIAKPKLEPNS